MNKALKRKVNNISMPVEIHRNEWLMLFCIHLASSKAQHYYKSLFPDLNDTAKEQRLIRSTAWLWFLDVSVEQTALKLQYFTSPVFTSQQPGSCVVKALPTQFCFFAPLALFLPCLQRSRGLLSTKYTAEQLCSRCAWEATFPPRRMRRSDPQTNHFYTLRCCRSNGM